jgi:Flp pilus assembly CpaE family ATPase
MRTPGPLSRVGPAAFSFIVAKRRPRRKRPVPIDGQDTGSTARLTLMAAAVKP